MHLLDVPAEAAALSLKIRGQYVFKKLLLVCVGNICRSPTAEILFRHRLRERGGVEVASAGLQALVGQPVDATAALVLRERGHDPVGHQARQATPSVLGAADLILVMERAHLAQIAREVPHVSGKTFLLGHWGGFEVPDPYRQQRVAFEHVYGLMEQGAESWAKYIS